MAKQALQRFGKNLVTTLGALRLQVRRGMKPPWETKEKVTILAHSTLLLFGGHLVRIIPRVMEGTTFGKNLVTPMAAAVTPFVLPAAAAIATLVGAMMIVKGLSSRH
ncbi:MAG TPA: hypothetical protein VF173_28625 [Thermoanaerobaculia bacterium]|nr:hypothetical protein [Thermoanaerobaculia bacterium]